MKFPRLCPALLAGIVTASCQGQPAATTQRPPAKTTAAPPKPAHAISPVAPAAAPHAVRGILDPGMNNMVAFALKIPSGWQLMPSFTRKRNGAQPVSQVSLRMMASGGQQQIDVLPERPYYYHVCQDRNGALHGSNVPLDAGALNWQELQQTGFKNI